MSDLIDRQALLKQIDIDSDGEPGYYGDTWKFIDTIKSLPSAQPEQRTGKWIPQDHNKRAGNISTCVYCYPICSKCGKVGIETYKYCPMCGAKMEGANDE